MTTCLKHKKRGGSKPALSSCLTNTAAATQCALTKISGESRMLNKLINTTGGGKNQGGGESTNQTCPGTSVSTVVPTYISGNNQHMSPNGNDNINAAMQLQASQQGQAIFDSTAGWDKIQQNGGAPSLENFIENINNMAGGKKRKTKRRRKRYRVDTRKKRYKNSRYLRGRTRPRKRSRRIKRMRRRSKKS